MTITEMLNLESFLKEISTKELSFNLAYKFTKISEVFDKNHSWYFDQIQKLLDKYGEKDDNGELVQENESIKIKKETANKFNEKIGELLKVEITDTIPTFNLDELKDMTISPADLHNLMPLIKE